MLVLKHVLTRNLVALLLRNLLALYDRDDAALQILAELAYRHELVESFIVYECEDALWDQCVPLLKRPAGKKLGSTDHSCAAIDYYSRAVLMKLPVYLDPLDISERGRSL